MLGAERKIEVVNQHPLESEAHAEDLTRAEVGVVARSDIQKRLDIHKTIINLSLPIKETSGRIFV